jgi:hypothetical protein
LNKYVYVNIPEGSKENFQIGLDQEVWGWPNRGASGVPGEAFDHLETSPDTSYLVFAQGLGIDPPVPKGWPRTKPDDMSAWQRARWKRMVVGRVTSKLYQDIAEVWPDGAYPWRVTFQAVTMLEDVHGSAVPSPALEALRYSTIQHSQPALGPEPILMEAEGDDTVDEKTDPSTSEENHQVPDRILGELDNLDGFVRRKVRKEQMKLRKARFGNAKETECALCGRTLPTSIVRLAHIKRRSHAVGAELLDLNNTMGACTLGCDELFERGILTVDDSGTILVDIPGSAGDLHNFVQFYDGRQLSGFKPAQQVFFAWHRKHCGDS